MKGFLCASVAALIVGTTLSSCSSLPREDHTTLWRQALVMDVVWVRALTSSQPWAMNGYELSQPVVVEHGNLIVLGTSQGRLQGIDVRTGRTLWQLDMSEGIEAPGVVHNGVLYIGGLDGILYALDANAGRELWRFDTRGPIQAPVAVSNNRVIVANASHQVFALDTEDGSFVWRKERKVQNDFTIYGHGTPTIDGENVFVGFADGQLMVYALDDGATIWGRDLSRDAKRFRDIDVAPVIHDDRVFVSSFTGGLFSLNANDGSIIWHIDIEGCSDMALRDGLLYFSSLDYVHALNTSSGEHHWFYELPKDDVLSAPVLGDRFLFVSQRNTGLLVLERSSGRLVTLSDAGTGFSSPPAIFHHNVFALSNGGKLYALRLFEGS